MDLLGCGVIVCLKPKFHFNWPVLLPSKPSLIGNSSKRTILGSTSHLDNTSRPHHKTGFQAVYIRLVQMQPQTADKNQPAKMKLLNAKPGTRVVLPEVPGCDPHVGKEGSLVPHIRGASAVHPFFQEFGFPGLDLHFFVQCYTLKTSPNCMT